MLVLNSPIRVLDQLAFGHDGRRLYAAGSNVPDLRYQPDNRGIDVWTIAGKRDPGERLLPNELVAGFAVNPASGWLYIGTGYAYGDGDDVSAYFAVNPKNGKAIPLGLTGGNSFALAVHPSGRWLVGAGYAVSWQSTSGWKNQVIVRWRQPAGSRPIEQWRLPSGDRFDIHQIACDAGAERIVTHGLERGKPVTDLVYELQLRDSANGEVLGNVPGPCRTIHQLLFSPDGSRLVLRGGPSFFVWDAGNFGEKPRKVSAGKMQLTALAFHPSGLYLAATSNDTTVKLYDTESWQIAKTFTWNVGRLRSIAFSPDGMLAAVGSDTGKIVVWDVDD